MRVEPPRGSAGACEATGACSFPDSSCPSDRRYGVLGDPPACSRCRPRRRNRGRIRGDRHRSCRGHMEPLAAATRELCRPVERDEQAALRSGRARAPADATARPGRPRVPRRASRRARRVARAARGARRHRDPEGRGGERFAAASARVRGRDEAAAAGRAAERPRGARARPCAALCIAEGIGRPRELVPHERALAIHETSLGFEHPDVATSLDNLETVHSRWVRTRKRWQ